MKPEDILDGLGHINEQMVLDAENLKKSPRRSLKIGSMAACILCGVTLLGLCAAKLWNQQEQQSKKPPEPTLPPVTSVLPQDSAEESNGEGTTPELRTLNPEDSLGSVYDYQVVARADGVYFVDPYIGLMSIDPETKTTKTILPNGPCSLAESDGSLYCLNQANGQVALVENGDVTTVATLENMGPGYPILQGVSNGYVCWQQDWNIYATSMDDGTTRKLTDVESGMMDPCGVYQGSLYGVDLSRGTLCRIDLGSGETETLWEAASDWQQGDAEGDQVRIDASIISANADMDGDRLYLEAVQTADDVQQYGYFCYELTTGELRELTTLDDSNTMLNIQNGNLYLLHTEMEENGDQVMELLCYDGETGELSVVMDHDQLAEISNIGSCSVASAASDGLYYIRNSAVPDPQPQLEGLYYYDFAAGTDILVYQSSGLYGSLVAEPDFYWQQGGSNDAGEWYENFNVVKEYCDLTYTENGVYYVDPASGVYRYIPEEERTEQLVSGIACRILNCDEGLYATCSDSGEVYEIRDGTAQLLLTLEKAQQIAVKPIAVKNGTLYWNYYVTDLTTGETETDALFRLKKSQPQILHDGKIYCLGGNGEIGYVDLTGGTESYEPLTGALGTKDDQWEVKFFDDCIIVLQRDENSSKYQVYRISYEDGSSKWLGTVMGSSVNILNLEGDTLYLEPMNDSTPIWVLGINVNTGESLPEAVKSAVFTLQDAAEVEVWQGTCYYVKRSYDTGAVTEFGTYDLETETNTTYTSSDGVVTE